MHAGLDGLKRLNSDPSLKKNDADEAFYKPKTFGTFYLFNPVKAKNHLEVGTSVQKVKGPLETVFP